MARRPLGPFPPSPGCESCQRQASTQPTESTANRHPRHEPAESGPPAARPRAKQSMSALVVGSLPGRAEVGEGGARSPHRRQPAPGPTRTPRRTIGHHPPRRRLRQPRPPAPRRVKLDTNVHKPPTKDRQSASHDDRARPRPGRPLGRRLDQAAWSAVRRRPKVKLCAGAGLVPGTTPARWRVT